MDQKRLAEEMVKIVGNKERVISGELDLMYYSFDASFYTKLNTTLSPDVVVLPQSTEEVSKIMKFAYENNIAVTPRGAATGETGGCVATNRGIVLDLSTWDEIIEVDAANMQCFVRPGVIHAKLNDHLAKFNLTFPPDPGSSAMATVGGMVANNSSGLRAVKYGATENYVLGLEIVLPNGDVIVTGGENSRAVKTVSGMNINKLFVGSEGTLGIITRIRLRCWPMQKARGLIMAVFDNLDDAPAAVLDVYQSGILPSGIEILDDSAIYAVNLYKPELNLPPAQAILLYEIDGNPASVEWEGNTIVEVVKKRAKQVEFSTDPKRMAALWEGRSVTATAAARVKPEGSRIFAGEDISVPLNKVTEVLTEIKRLAAKYAIKVVLYGHIGDGNVHTAPVIDAEKPEEVAAVIKLVDEIHRAAIRMGGSVTGEHGVGIVRKNYMPAEHGKAVFTMDAIKKALDPKGIMNPGKLFVTKEE